MYFKYEFNETVSLPKASCNFLKVGAVAGSLSWRIPAPRRILLNYWDFNNVSSKFAARPSVQFATHRRRGSPL